MLIDIGVNLTSSQFRKDLPEVIQRAFDADVTPLIVTGTDIDSSHAAYQLSLDYPHKLYSTAGIHPHHANDYNNQSIEQLLVLQQCTNVVAIGECGLDFNRDFSPQKQQLDCFEAQLELAVELKKPLFLHQRDAHNEFLRLLKKYRSNLVGGVAHCFTGGRKELEAYLELDLHIGITGWLCDERRGKELQQTITHIPLDRIMLETDAPYLFPRDMKKDDGTRMKKSGRNEPRYLPHIAATAAMHMSVDKELLINRSTLNAIQLFKLADDS